VLILDEPTAGLDPVGRTQILDNIFRYRKKSGATVLIVSHSMDDVARFAERIIVFHEGTVAMDGVPSEVFSHAQELMEIGLNVPKAAELAVALRKRNIPLPESVFTHEQLITALLTVREGKTC
jgi:energy-coupling factor transport system ATP-binding protein